MSGPRDQVTEDSNEFGLVSRTLGGLPIVNHILERLGLSVLLADAMPNDDARLKLAPAVAIRLVITNLILGREPLYGLGEWAASFDPALLGLSADDLAVLNDDRVGRALEALFDADRASLLTAVVLRAISEFNIDTIQLHNDSTSISVHGAYADAVGTARGGQPTPVITWGHSKDHRPDLKQLVWILTNEISRASMRGSAAAATGRSALTLTGPFGGLLTDRAPAGSPVTELLMGCRARFGVST